MFAQESFVLAWFLRISKHNVWVSQSILLQLLPMKIQNPNFSCASAFVRQSRTFHNFNAFQIDETFYPEYHSGLIWIQTVFANVDWCRHVKVNIASADRQVEREREREVCVCVLFEFHQFFFTLGTRLRISKFCVDLCKKI